jgi:alanine racemase
MDLTIVDVTGVAPGIGPGTPVIIFNGDHPVTELAATLGTIPYEILTGISRRVKRVYYHE